MWDFAYAMQLRKKENQAQKTANSAISSVNLADQTLRKTQYENQSKQSLAQIEQKLFMTKSKLATATKSFEKINMRRKLISEFKIRTKSFSMTQNNASSQNILLRWILQQIPLIEFEFNSVGVTKNDSTQQNGKRRRNFKRNRIDDRNEESVSKRRKQNDENFMLSESKLRIFIISNIFSTQQQKESNKSYINSKILISDFYFQRALRAFRSSNIKSDAARSAVILNDSTPIMKVRRLKDKGFDGAPDSRFIRRSTRLKRAPDRFQ